MVELAKGKLGWFSHNSMYTDNTNPDLTRCRGEGGWGTIEVLPTTRRMKGQTRILHIKILRAVTRRMIEPIFFKQNPK